MDWKDMNQAAPPLRRAGYIIAVCLIRPRKIAIAVKAPRHNSEKGTSNSVTDKAISDYLLKLDDMSDPEGTVVSVTSGFKSRSVRGVQLPPCL
ncbi:hypothetical protein [Cupriavidus sp. SW-Y-13]|uniref:hypothetical protein n=1 Tax=Cupriavidus sp. SW-Y-13 TaxID=2653854 RepID=UPI0013664C3F|nr:hypothetical protein [Cupriavidus sp. SW-Y-13]MWL87981.1 hypothetical protein [Cupriavidus sp. SW-Y-13]